jgi:predicted alpha/beta hydrolase
MQEEQNIQSDVVRFAASDGRTLTGTLYAPADSNQRCVLLNGATAVKRGYYDAYARYLAAAGFTVLTYDYRGIGDSCLRSVQQEPGTMRQWGEADTAGAIAFLTQRHPGYRLLVVGHSAGGQLFGPRRRACWPLAVKAVIGAIGPGRAAWGWPRFGLRCCRC